MNSVNPPRMMKLMMRKREYLEAVEKLIHGLPDLINSHDLVVLACNLAENHFVERGMGVVKKQAVMEALDAYFPDKTELGRAVESVLANGLVIKHSVVIRVCVGLGRWIARRFLG